MPTIEPARQSERDPVAGSIAHHGACSAKQPQLNATEGELMNERKLVSSVGITLLFATASFAQQVKTDYDHEIDFAKYKTYSWEKVQTQDSLWVDRIKAAVNETLTAKGWTAVESGGDVAILAMEMNQNHSTLNTYYDGFGGGWRWGAGFGEPRQR
jgi:hypothetical protein